ncbi:MAG TPA: hypothetical protein VMU17_07595 [Elusimicrobiota bacterium]|nr:hypothetical protein [Elusimicrobiota bacterium]
MKKLLQWLSLGMLVFYGGLVATTAFHELCKNHVESHCTVCQVIHQTPVIGHAHSILQYHERFALLRIPIMAIRLADAEHLSRGRSPPVL